jgi:hypothetical protein
MTLYCPDCDCIKPKTEFYKNSARKNNCSTYCKMCMKRRTMEYTNNHKDERKEYQANWRVNNPEKARNSYLNWKKENKARVNANNAKRRAAKLRACPTWLSKEQMTQINEFYIQAQQLSMHVDHIIPLQGENVSGLHVPWNLQLLPSSENYRKSNKVR